MCLHLLPLYWMEPSLQTRPWLLATLALDRAFVLVAIGRPMWLRLQGGWVAPAFAEIITMRSTAMNTSASPPTESTSPTLRRARGRWPCCYTGSRRPEAVSVPDAGTCRCGLPGRRPGDAGRRPVRRSRLTAACRFADLIDDANGLHEVLGRQCGRGHHRARLGWLHHLGCCGPGARTLVEGRRGRRPYRCVLRPQRRRPVEDPAKRPLLLLPDGRGRSRLFLPTTSPTSTGSATIGRAPFLASTPPRTGGPNGFLRQSPANGCVRSRALPSTTSSPRPSVPTSGKWAGCWRSLPPQPTFYLHGAEGPRGRTRRRCRRLVEYCRRVRMAH